jgi:Immunity protein 50
LHGELDHPVPHVRRDRRGGDELLRPSVSRVGGRNGRALRSRRAGAEGSVKRADFTVAGQKLICIDDPIKPLHQTMSVYDDVINGNLIVERFGRWPSFHDAEVLSVYLSGHLPEQPSCEMVIHVWLMADKVDARRSYILEKHSLVTFRFEQLIESEFNNFNHQNCLSYLWIEEASFDNEPARRVRFPTNYGLGGSALCRRVVVVKVEPCDERGQPLDKECPATSGGLTDACNLDN